MSELPTSQYTGTFLELLANAKKSVLVSTYQAQKLVVLRAQNNQINTHFITLKKPMGVAMQNGRLSVGSGNSVIDYFNSPSAASKLEPLNTHDAAYLAKRAHITGDIDIHEMAFDKEGELWIVNTRMSCLCILDIEHSFVPRWRPPFISAYDGTDRCHLNGLAMRNGVPRYVTALGNTDTAQGWRDKKADGGILMDIESNQVIASGLSMPHSPRWYRDKLWVLESGAGKLLTIDTDNGAKTEIAQVPGFCRGIDFIEHYALIGLSEIRDTAVFAGLPLTADQQDRKCGIWIVDINRGESVAYLEFTQGIQEIFSVQLLPDAFPALLDFNHKLLDSSYSIPKNILDEFVSTNPNQIDLDNARQLHRQEKFAPAINLYRKLLKQDPNNTHIRYDLADALFHHKQPQEADSVLDDLLNKNSNHALALKLKGDLSFQDGQYEKARKYYQYALTVDQQYAEAHFQLGRLHLRQGEFEQGWPKYEWRVQTSAGKAFKLPHPQWRGEDIKTKRLLVLTENDDCDSILFARFLQAARQRCARLIVVCDAPLKWLFEQTESVDEVHLHGELPIELFDVYTSINSLALLLDIDQARLSNFRRYVDIQPTTMEPAHAGELQLNIGLLWRNNTSTESEEGIDEGPFESLLMLSRDLNARFHSLQYELGAQETHSLDDHLIEYSAMQVDYGLKTAELLCKMDLVICINHPIAHLAGALAIQTILLNTDQSDWRWMSGDRCLWYPTVKVVNKAKCDTWSNTIEQCSTLIDNANLLKNS